MPWIHDTAGSGGSWKGWTWRSLKDTQHRLHLARPKGTDLRAMLSLCVLDLGLQTRMGLALSSQHFARGVRSGRVILEHKELLKTSMAIMLGKWDRKAREVAQAQKCLRKEMIQIVFGGF